MEERKSSGPNNDISRRLFWSAAFVGLAYWVIFFASPLLYYLVAMFFILMGLNEYVTMAQNKGFALNRAVILCLGALAPSALGIQASSLYIVLVLCFLFLLNINKEGLSQSLTLAAIAFLGIVWVAWLFSYVIDLRYVTQGPRWVHYAIFVSKMGDAGAYFIGKNLGKKKFLPHISPNKTWEGALGQLGTSVVASCFSKFYLGVSLGQLVFLGCVLGIFAQIGDLVESMVKRNFEVKDSGTIPGLGGFLDIMDSMLFAIPIVYGYVTHLALS